MSPSRLHMMRFFRPRVLNPADLPEEVADRARALAVALANPYTPYDKRVVLRRAFSKRLSTQVWSVRFSAWDEFNRELWQRGFRAHFRPPPGFSSSGPRWCKNSWCKWHARIVSRGRR